jgi:dTDP-4-amino-4,6-dideoxy-D-galactose acyltransferase
LTSGAIEPLPWDSGFFGHSIARVAGDRLTEKQCEGVLAEAAGSGIELLYFLATADDPETIRVAQHAGFQLVDVRVELEADAAAVTRIDSPAPPGYALRRATAADVRVLRAIAAGAYTNSRFFADDRIDRSRAEELYATWIERSVCGDLADIVLVADLDGTPCAYITGRIRNDGASIGLLGVARSARGRGLGGRLVRSFAEFASDRGGTTVTVVTQGRNVNAQRIYQRCGFLTRSTNLWFHRWSR